MVTRRSSGVGHPQVWMPDAAEGAEDGKGIEPPPSSSPQFGKN